MNPLAADPSAAAAPDLWMSLLRSASMLCLVLAVLIGILYWVKRLLNNQGRYPERGYIKMLSSYHLAPKERIVLLDVLGEKILVGITPQNINCLTKISDDGTIQIPDKVPRHGFFQNLLKGAAGDSKLKTGEGSHDD